MSVDIAVATYIPGYPGGVKRAISGTLDEVRRITERTLSATGGTIGVADSGCRIICTAVGTHTVASAATLLAGFTVEIINDSGGNVVLDGTGATNVTLADGDVATLICANSKVRVSKGASTVVS